MTNKDVIESFISKSANATTNVFSTGVKLYSYSTCIAEWIGESVLILNLTKYSNTTTRHSYILRRALPPYIKCVTVDNIRINTSDLKKHI